MKTAPMLPMLEFRNEIAGHGDWQTGRDRRDFRKRDGRLQWHNNRLVHGPYTKETREYFLRRLLEVELLVHEIGPDEIKGVPLITMEAVSYTHLDVYKRQPFQCELRMERS